MKSSHNRIRHAQKHRVNRDVALRKRVDGPDPSNIDPVSHVSTVHAVASLENVDIRRFNVVQVTISLIAKQQLCAVST